MDSTDLPRFGGNVFCNLDRLLLQNYHLYNLQRHISGEFGYFSLRKLNVAEVKVSNQNLSSECLKKHCIFGRNQSKISTKFVTIEITFSNLLFGRDFL